MTKFVEILVRSAKEFGELQKIPESLTALNLFNSIFIRLLTRYQKREEPLRDDGDLRVAGVKELGQAAKQDLHQYE